MSTKKFGYEFDEGSKEWKVADKTDPRGDEMRRRIEELKRSPAFAADTVNADLGSPEKNQEPSQGHISSPSPMKADPRIASPSKIGRRVNVYYEAKSGGSSRFEKGVIVGEGNNNNYLVKWDHLKKPKEVVFSPSDNTYDKNNSERWQYIEES